MKRKDLGTSPLDYRIVVHKYRDRRGDWIEEPRVHWNTWPGTEAPACPYSDEQVREAHRKEDEKYR